MVEQLGEKPFFCRADRGIRKAPRKRHKKRMIRRGAAAAEHNCTVCHAKGFTHVVRNHEYGHAPAVKECSRFILELQACERIERAEGFIHQQNVRLCRKRPREPRALLLAAREFRGKAFSQIRNTGKRQRLRDCCRFAGFGKRLPRAGREGERRIFSNRFPRQEERLLKHHGNFRIRPSRRIRRRKPHSARLREEQSRSRLKERRFAASRTAEHRRYGAGRYGKRQVIHRRLSESRVAHYQTLERNAPEAAFGFCCG